MASLEQIRSLQIVSKRLETPDTVTFTLVATDGQPFAYLPGQFLSILLEENGQEKRRAYSFCSSPVVDGQPTITVKRVPNGAFSNWLFSHAETGAILQTTPAGGRFLLPEPLPARLIYVAAGSGITPVMSHLKSLLAQPDPPEILLLYANRDIQHTIFKRQLDAWMEAFPTRFTCQYLLSREKNAPHILQRHLNNELLEQLIKAYYGGRISARDRSQSQIFLCAPTPMMRMAEMTLRVMDFPAKSIHKEIFQPVAPKNLPLLDASKTHHIRVRAEGVQYEFETFEGETILNAALRQGLKLPYSCKTGVCFTCIARCTKGLVDVRFAETTNREGAGKMVNTCIGYAVSEMVELEYGGR
jgi:ring-1,2-phenylacetyl-CoA epoxidase subunit PaaE